MVVVEFNSTTREAGATVIEIVRPGDLLFRIRQQLASLISEGERASSLDESF